MNTNEKYMLRCIALAQNGLGTTYPNPLVGSVVVHNGLIIGEGWHRKAGEPHAEVNAINSVANKTLLSKSTLYVNLEPCSHFGKTPPCADLIISHRIPKVVIGTLDPHSLVCGNGQKKLEAAGISVTVGILEKECHSLNKRFFTFQNKKRPYVILKWAQSTDGFMAPLTKTEQKPVWLSNHYSRQLVHKWRSEEQAILVGTNTVINDNPFLTTRHWSGTNPIRIVIDRHNRISKESHIFDKQATTIVISEDDNDYGIDFNDNVGLQICDILFRNKILSVIIEGGKQTLETFINANLWDEARVFQGSTILENGLKAPELRKANSEKQTIDDDELLIFYNDDQHYNI